MVFDWTRVLFLIILQNIYFILAVVFRRRRQHWYDSIFRRHGPLFCYDYCFHKTLTTHVAVTSVFNHTCWCYFSLQKTLALHIAVNSGFIGHQPYVLV